MTNNPTDEESQTDYTPMIYQIGGPEQNKYRYVISRGFNDEVVEAQFREGEFIDCVMTLEGYFNGNVVLLPDAEVERLQRERGWQAIETAPKDGTNFLACSPASSVFYAHYANGIVDSSDWSDGGGYAERYAMLWMPLPSPPAATTQPDSEQSEFQEKLFRMMREAGAEEIQLPQSDS